MIDYQKPYPSGWEDKPSRRTPITADVLNYYDSTVEAITEEINNIPSTYALITKAGYSLELNIDHETYVMTLQLKNIKGAVLDEKTIDFPIESMIVNATYADGIITLILQNGNTTDVDVSGLISGLVNDTFTIAGIDMKDNITAEELLAALGLDNVQNDISEIKVALQKEEITSVVGTTPMTLNDSYAGGIKVNEIDGGSEQFSTTGAQLFDKDNATYVQNMAIDGNNKFTTFNGTRMYYAVAKPNTTYTYSKTIGSVCRICSCPNIPTVGGEVTNIKLNTTQNVETITTGENDNYIAIYPLKLEETKTISWDDVLNSVMISEGDTALPWEPYTGGVAAPNPDYPQEIKSVGGASINLFNIDGDDYIAGYYPDKNGGFSVSGTGNNAYIVEVEPNTTYSISRKMYNNISTMRINAYSEYPTISSVGSVLATMNENTLNYIFTTLEDTQYIAFYCSQLNTDQGARLANIMINEGNIPLPYTPYGVTTVIRTHGNNLCDGRLRQGNSSNITLNSSVTSAYGIPCKAGDVFSVSCKGMKVDLILLSNNAYINPEGTIQTSGYIEDNATMECQYNGFVKIQFRKTDGSALTPVEVQSMEIMWNKGEVMPYEPYQESVAYLSETLRGIGDVKDRIVRKDGVWQIERNIAQYVFKGTETFSKGNSSDTLQSFTFALGVFAHGDILCNYLPYEDTAVASATKESVWDKAENGALYLRVNITRASTIEELKAWLSELYNQVNPLTVQYKMLTPTYEPLPESEQVALHSLESYDTVTYISCDSEVEPTIDVEYGTSRVGGYTLDAWNTAKRNEINNAQLNSAILSLGGNV